MKKQEQTIKKHKIYQKINKTFHLEDKKFNSLELILIIIMTFVVGTFFSKIAFYQNNNHLTLEKNLQEIQKVYNTLLQNYSKDITEKDLTEAAISGMMRLSPDQYSLYMNKQESEEFMEELEGKYLGIGIEITKDEQNITTVYSVREDSPAFKAGLEAKDKIKKINDEDVSTMSLNELTTKIRNSKAKKINMTIEREKETINTVVELKEIEIESVKMKTYELENKKVGKITIETFAKNTDEQFEDKLNQLNKENITSIIIDIRSNVGGHLESVTNILNNFINKKQVMYQIENDGKIKKIYGKNKEVNNYDIIILTNSGSASASEVLATALKEVCNATLIGTKTYGKGTIQTTLPLSNGGMLKYTSEKWLTSKGNSINKIGIIPDIELELNTKYYETAQEEDDNQLQKALELLNNN